MLQRENALLRIDFRCRFHVIFTFMPRRDVRRRIYVMLIMLQ